jgi:c-di-GMP-binding flagellar brake protein YcgR
MVTSTARALSPSRRDELIKVACDQNLAGEMLVWLEGKIVKHPTRMLASTKDAAGQHVLIEMPVESGHPVPYPNGQDLEVVFHLGSERYAFSGEVQGRCFHNIRPGQRLPAIILPYPVKLENRQRRAHYRVPLDVSDPVTIAFVVTSGPGPFTTSTNIHSGVVSDISAGGAAIICNQILGPSIAVGTPMFVSFQLPGDREQINLESMVRNFRKADSNESQILGLEFVNFDKDISSRRYGDAIQRFVVTRQRELLKRLRVL